MSSIVAMILTLLNQNKQTTALLKKKLKGEDELLPPDTKEMRFIGWLN